MTSAYEIPMPPAVEPHRPEQWSEEMAQKIALRDGVGRLGEEHWRVIHFLREHFMQYGAAPPMKLACSRTHLDARCGERLFRGAQEAWRIAGLPEPGSEDSGYAV